MICREQTIIAQDAVLFTGSIRRNLDPFDEHSDEECWSVLEKTCDVAHPGVSTSAPDASEPLKGTSTQDASELADPDWITSLDQQVSQGGQNFSVGQRQLLAMARAVLRGSNIFIMDEVRTSDIADHDLHLSVPLYY